MDLIVSSRNKDKIAELTDALTGLDLTVRGVAEFPEIDDVEETGTTLTENAFLKARAVFEKTGALSLADDTGLEIDALGGAPGVYSARYGGPEQSYEKNLQKVLSSLDGVPEPERTARFRTVIAIIFPGGEEIPVEGVCHGQILTERRGKSGFGYDPVFYLPEQCKTFAEMDLAEKQLISHRGLAMKQAAEIIGKWLQEHC